MAALIVAASGQVRSRAVLRVKSVISAVVFRVDSVESSVARSTAGHGRVLGAERGRM